jgi:hypothetical protein
VPVGTSPLGVTRLDAAAFAEARKFAVAPMIRRAGATDWHPGHPGRSCGTWFGPLSWRKPAVFGFSFAVTDIAVAWILGYLPERRSAGWLLRGPSPCST